MLLCLLLPLCCVDESRAQVKFNECLGAHGERMFSDRADCGAADVREWSLPLPPAAENSPAVDSYPKQRRRQARGGNRVHTARSPDSYQCTAGDQVWYQHSPCRGSGAKGESVRQTRVSRRQACREVDRPAAVLRLGSQRDERAGPYARATGRDPCR